MLKDGETICKPLNENEHKFYEMLSQHPELIPPAFYPKYFGTRTIERDPEDSDAPTSNSCLLVLLFLILITYCLGLEYIVLEDLTRKMIKPCACDLKMGANSRVSAVLYKHVDQLLILL